MSHHCHCRRPRHPSSFKIPNGRSPEIVRNASGHSGDSTCCSPGCIEVPNWLAASVEHGCDNSGVGAFESFRVFLLRLQYGTELGRQVEHPSPSIRRLSGLQAYPAAHEIDVTPSARQQLGLDTPASTRCPRALQRGGRRTRERTRAERVGSADARGTLSFSRVSGDGGRGQRLGRVHPAM